MKRLYNKLVNVEKDKLLHFMVSFFITLFSFAILNRYFRDTFSFDFLSTIGIEKESKLVKINN